MSTHRFSFRLHRQLNWSTYVSVACTGTMPGQRLGLTRVNLQRKPQQYSCSRSRLSFVTCCCCGLVLYSSPLWAMRRSVLAFTSWKRARCNRFDCQHYPCTSETWKHNRMTTANTGSTFVATGSTTQLPYDTNTTATLAVGESSLHHHQQQRGFERIFDLQLPEGRCVGIQLVEDLAPEHPDSLARTNRILWGGRPHSAGCGGGTSDGASAAQQPQHHWIYSRLHPDEISYGLALSSELSQRSFWLGRLAVRHALDWDYFRPEQPAILKDECGRPVVPSGFLGSISHKGRIGVALLAASGGDDDDTTSVGVDIEESETRRRSVASKVLTPRERESLGRIQVGFNRVCACVYACFA
jgi:hypothetical protein